jgi:hypothetical protein
MRLAVVCGQYDVDAMLESMTSQQFDEWVAYYKLEPFGYEPVKDTIANAGAAVCHAFGAKVMPWMILGKDEPKNEVAPNQAAVMFGGSHGHNR